MAGPVKVDKRKVMPVGLFTAEVIAAAGKETGVGLVVPRTRRGISKREGGKVVANTEDYRQEVIDPGDRASAAAKEVCFQSHGNCPALAVVPHVPGNFRGPVGWAWKPHILAEMAKTQFGAGGQVEFWEMLEEVENDGAGGKPQFFTLVGTPEVMRGLGWEIIAMTADDFARSGRFPAIMVNDLNVKRVTKANFPLVQAMFEGYGEALAQSGMVNVTGEIAIMKHSITAFCDDGSDEQLVLTWGGACVGLSSRRLLIDGSAIKPGMFIVGLKERGYRCNGGTWFTKLLLAKFGPEIAKIRANSEAMELARKLVVPSISYAKTLTRVAGWNPDGSVSEPLVNMAGIAHITGGGVWGKFGEILPEGVGAKLDNMPEPPEVLLQAQKLSQGTPHELPDLNAYGTLHGGCGMLVVCKTEADARKLVAEAAADWIGASIVGMTTESADGEVRIESRFRENRWLSSKELEE